MKSIMLASVALLSFTGLSGVATAQTMPDQVPGAAMPSPEATPPAPTDGSMPPPPAPDGGPGMAPPPPPGNAPATPPPADPNAGQPAGPVPDNVGMAPAPAGAPKDAAAPMGSSANPVTVGGNVTPPPTEAKDYPVCSRTVTDSCVNRSEARKGRKR
ncbi:Fe-S oxidoreductase [Sphingobium sp.]|uniref:Fe-S oxidoreductase n=1 Tax=Sphingobium sp. TaxID=1912891 RepID=UPI003BB56A30